MTRSLTVLAALALATAPSAALASKGHSKHHSKSPAKVLRATLKPVQADVANYTAFTGKAQFVANKRNAKISIQLKHMVPGATYPWAVVTGSCDGAAVTGLKYKTLKARPSGVATSKGYSKRGKFTFDKSAKYYAVVYQTGTTEPLLCGQLKAKAKKPHKGKGGSKNKTQQPKGKGKSGK